MSHIRLTAIILLSTLLFSCSKDLKTEIEGSNYEQATNLIYNQNSDLNLEELMADPNLINLHETQTAQNGTQLKFPKSVMYV